MRRRVQISATKKRLIKRPAGKRYKPPQLQGDKTIMKFILGLIYFLLCVINLIYNVFVEKYQHGWEAVLVVGITCIGIYLSWTVMKGSVKR